VEEILKENERLKEEVEFLKQIVDGLSVNVDYWRGLYLGSHGENPSWDNEKPAIL
jgi:hypothetical protein